MSRSSSSLLPAVRPSAWTTALLLLCAEGCFSPNAQSNQDDDGDDGSTSAATDSSVSDEGTTAMTSPSTSAESDTSDPTPDDSTTADSDDPDSGSDDDSPAPFCGDGKIDDGEECDDGEDNGPGQACRSDCQLNICGDGDPGPGEACDDGAGNALELGACAPNCSKVIDAKIIRHALLPLSQQGILPDGDLGADPISWLDGVCNAGSLEGYKALFSIPGGRRAATSSYQADPIDWVLEPYTAYVRHDGELVWITDDIPLLGVRNGASEPLVNPIGTTGARIISGMHGDWTTAVTGTCDGWTSSSFTLSVAYGWFTSDELYLRGAGTGPCSGWNQVAAGAPSNSPPTVNRTTWICVEHE